MIRYGALRNARCGEQKVCCWSFLLAAGGASAACEGLIVRGWRQRRYAVFASDQQERWGSVAAGGRS